MAASVVTDTIRNLSAEEWHGVIIRLTRECLVIDVDDHDIGGITETVFTALDTAGFTVGSILPDHENLVLTGRKADIHEGDPRVYIVALTYEKFGNEGQSIDAPVHGGLFIRSQTSLQQVMTNRYPDVYPSDPSMAGKQIEVKHTFPDGTATYKGADGETLPADPDFPGQEKIQGGEISIYEPQETITVDGILAVDAPWAVTEAMVGFVNSVPWMGQDARKWMCTGAPYESHALESVYRWLFHFEFQLNRATWDPTAVFIDARQGKPPPGLVANVGYKTIKYQGEIDFGTYFTMYG